MTAYSLSWLQNIVLVDFEQMHSIFWGRLHVYELHILDGQKWEERKRAS